MLRKPVIASIVAIGLLLSGCDSAVLIDPTNTANQGTTIPEENLTDLIATAEAAGNFTTLLSALDSADLRATLADTNNINTVFAPTDSAFNNLGTDALNELLADPARLEDTLLYHVLAGSNDGTTLTAQAGSQLTMLNGKPVALTAEQGQLSINTSNVVTADIAATNGIIHSIDTVLLPPVTPAAPTDTIAQLVSNDPEFSTLLDALVATGLDDTLAQSGTFTVFAPTNAAFSKLDLEFYNLLLSDPDLLREALRYHVVEGQSIDSITALAAAGTSITAATGESLAISINDGSLTINDATVTQSDLTATNGVVHAIDTVLLAQANGEPNTIVGVLAANPDYSELVALVTQAGLVDTLNSADGNYTVFAPNNAAIAAAQTQLSAGITTDTAALANLLLGHVTGTRLTSAEVVALDGTDLDMVFGAQPIVLTREVLSIGGAIIVDPDIQSSNGTIHGISSVIFP